MTSFPSDLLPFIAGPVGGLVVTLFFLYLFVADKITSVDSAKQHSQEVRDSDAALLEEVRKDRDRLVTIVDTLSDQLRVQQSLNNQAMQTMREVAEAPPLRLRDAGRVTDRRRS